MQLKHFLGLACLFLVFGGCDATPVTGPLPTDDQIDPNPPNTRGTPGGAPPAAPAVEAEGDGEGESEEAAQAPEPPKAPEYDFGTTKPVYKQDQVYLAGQPGQDDIQKIADEGVKQVISLCKEGEIDWDEKAAVEEAGMAYHSVPIGSPEDLTPETFEKVRQLLSDAGDGPVLLHCRSATRAKAVWIPYRALDQGKGVRGAVTGLRDMENLPEDWLSPGALYATEKSKEAKSK